MIITSRAEVERQTRSYFENGGPHTPIPPGVKFLPFSKAAVVKIPDNVRLMMQESSARDAGVIQRHQEYLAKHKVPEESVYTRYGKLSTDADREAFIQKLVDKTMAGYAFFNECERRDKEAAEHGTSGYTPNWPPNSVIRSAAIGMYQSVQNTGGSASTSEQDKGTAA